MSLDGQEYKALCDAAKAHDLKYLGKNLDEKFGLAFEGIPCDFFRDYCRKVFEIAVNPEKEMPRREMVYKPTV